MSEPELPLPCIVCGFQPARAFSDDRHPHLAYVPYAATMFDAGTGHYGSTVWDVMTASRSLSINVCDACLVKRKDRVKVMETIRREAAVKFVTWRPGDDD